MLIKMMIAKIIILLIKVILIILMLTNMMVLLTKLRTAIAFVPVLTEKPQQHVVRKGILQNVY